MSKRWNMSNDEAVEWLLNLKNLDICGENRKTAIDKAVTALKAQPSEDCISRAEVRKVLSNEVFELMKLHTVNPEDNPKADAIAYGVNWSLNTLMELPSVTPQRPKGKWIQVDPLGMGIEAYMCSACKTGDWSVTVGEYKFCPYCGAEMSGGGEDGS